MSIELSLSGDSATAQGRIAASAGTWSPSVQLHSSPTSPRASASKTGAPTIIDHQLLLASQIEAHRMQGRGIAEPVELL